MASKAFEDGVDDRAAVIVTVIRGENAREAAFLIASELENAHKVGRRAGLEEAAKVAEAGACGGDSKCFHERCATQREKASAIRKLIGATAA